MMQYKTFFLSFATLLLSVGLFAQKQADLYESPVFDPAYYAERYPDVEEDDALRHWKEEGIKKGRCASPVFDPSYYLKKNPDVIKKIGGKKDYEAAAKHWLKYGIQEGRPSHPDFQMKYYVKNNQDLYKSYGLDFRKLLDHYLTEGRGEGRKATP